MKRTSNYIPYSKSILTITISFLFFTYLIAQEKDRPTFTAPKIVFTNTNLSTEISRLYNEYPLNRIFSKKEVDADGVSENLQSIVKLYNTIGDNIDETVRFSGPITNHLKNELINRNFQKEILRFIELYSTYSVSRKKIFGRKKFIKEYRPELDTLISYTRNMKREILSNPQLTSIPSISILQYLEYGCLTMLKFKSLSIETVLDQYSTFISELQADKLKSTISKLKKQRTEEIEAANYIEHFESRVKEDSRNGCWFIRVGYLIMQSNNDNEYENEQVNKLIKQGIIESNERVVIVSNLFNSRIPGCVEQTLSGDLNKDGSWDTSLKKEVKELPIYLAYKAKKEKEKKTKEKKVKNTTLKLYIYKALNHCAEHALMYNHTSSKLNSSKL